MIPEKKRVYVDEAGTNLGMSRQVDGRPRELAHIQNARKDGGNVVVDLNEEKVVLN